MHKQSLQKPAEQQLGMQPVVETAPEVTGQEEMVLLFVCLFVCFFFD